MADAIARAREIHAFCRAYTLKIEVVVCVLRPHLAGVVVHVLHRELGFHTLHAHRLQLQKSHRAGGVLAKRLVYTDLNRCAGNEFTLHKMRSQNLFN